MKGPGTSFQSPQKNWKQVESICHKFHFDTTYDCNVNGKRYFYNDVASLMTQHILKFAESGLLKVVSMRQAGVSAIKASSLCRGFLEILT